MKETDIYTKMNEYDAKIKKLFTEEKADKEIVHRQNDYIDIRYVNKKELETIKKFLSKNGINFEYSINKRLFTNFMEFWNENSILQMDTIITKISKENLNLLKKYFGIKTLQIKQAANAIRNLRYLEKNIQHFIPSYKITLINFRKDAFETKNSSNENLDPIGSTINKLNNKCKKIILTYFPKQLLNIKNPDKELLKTAIISSKFNSYPGYIFSKITLPEELQIYGIKECVFKDTYEIKDITPKAKSFLIHMNAHNYNSVIKHGATLMELNKKEKNLVRKRITESKPIENYNKWFIKQDYKNIEKIPNPSDEIRRLAINEFRKKWER